MDFLNGNERYSVVELMRVTVCMSQLLRAVSLRHFVLNLQLGRLRIKKWRRMITFGFPYAYK